MFNWLSQHETNLDNCYTGINRSLFSQPVRGTNNDAT